MKKSIYILIALMFAAVISKAQTTAWDDFERHMLGSNWSVYFGSGNVEIVDSSDLGFPSSGYFTIVGWTANTFAADQYSEIIISPNKADSMLCQAFVRRRSSDNARYGFHYNPAYGGRYEIKYDGVPTAQTRILDSLISVPPLNGDTLRIQISGMTISGYHNGVLVVQATDTAFATSNPITSTGVPGIAFRFNSISFPATYPSPVIEQWNGGALPATGLNDIQNSEPINIFPNPSSDKITLQSNINLQNAEIKIFNVIGETFLQKTISVNKMDIDITALPQSIYILQIKSENKLFNQIFVKQ